MKITETACDFCGARARDGVWVYCAAVPPSMPVICELCIDRAAMWLAEHRIKQREAKAK